MFIKANQDQGLKPVQVVAAIIYNENNEILIAKRNDKPGFWEFPGGKVEPQEDNQTALCRELQEELGIDAIKIIGLFDRYQYDYPNKRVELFFYECYLQSNTGLQKNVHAELKWVKAKALLRDDFLPGNQRIIMALCAEQQKL